MDTLNVKEGKMKKILGIFFFLSCLVITVYSQEINEKEGRKVLEQIRREIQNEEKAKQKAIEDAEKVQNSSRKRGREKREEDIGRY